MGNSIKISLVLVVLIIGIIVTSTTIKVNKDHREKLILVSESRLEEAARNCYLDEVCTGSQVSLKELIEKKYIEEQIHPITKEFIDRELKINCENYICNTDLS